MSFKENGFQQISISDSFTGLTEREQKALEKSWAKVFADEIFPAIDEISSITRLSWMFFRRRFISNSWFSVSKYLDRSTSTACVYPSCDGVENCLLSAK